MTIRSYVRRSKNDEGKQQFSLDVQRAGCKDFATALRLGTKSIVDYADDGKSGDDFHTRAGLRKLIADVRPGDIVVCRDQSRLGRDAIEVTLVVRDLVRDRGCRLYYYTTGQQVQFSNAIDQATTFIQGTGHQMELEAIRSRTREALRSRVRAGRVAGGKCYGYRLERQTDGSGRSFTIAIVNEEEAAIVRRIFEEYLQDRGLKLIAHRLNEEGIAPPCAGRRSTGSWSPAAIRGILLNPRYRGLYVHGKVKKVRRGGVVERVKAEPEEVLTVEVPEWRIVDDETWCAVAERFAARVGTVRTERPTRAVARYALTGFARCAHCNGPIGVMRSRHGKETFKAYGCYRRHERGKAVCSVTVAQRTEEVEATLIDYLQGEVLTARTLDLAFAAVRQQIEAQKPQVLADVSALEDELRNVKAEQQRLTQALALSDDVPGLVGEVKRRNQRAKFLQLQIETAKKAGGVVERQIFEVETRARDKFTELRAALTKPEDMRPVFRALFPDGVRLSPHRSATQGESRWVWKIEGRPSLGSMGGLFSTLVSDPDDAGSQLNIGSRVIPLGYITTTRIRPRIRMPRAVRSRLSCRG